MHRAFKLLARFLVITTVAAVISVLAVPSSPTHTPYLSALFDLAGGSVFAQPACEHKVCSLHHGNKCNSVDPSRLVNCVQQGGPSSCMTVSC